VEYALAGSLGFILSREYGPPQANQSRTATLRVAGVPHLTWHAPEGPTRYSLVRCAVYYRR